MFFYVKVWKKNFTTIYCASTKLLASVWYEVRVSRFIYAAWYGFVSWILTRISCTYLFKVFLRVRTTCLLFFLFQGWIQKTRIPFSNDMYLPATVVHTAFWLGCWISLGHAQPLLQYSVPSSHWGTSTFTQHRRLAYCRYWGRASLPPITSNEAREREARAFFFLVFQGKKSLFISGRMRLMGAAN